MLTIVPDLQTDPSLNTAHSGQIAEDGRTTTDTSPTLAPASGATSKGEGEEKGIPTLAADTTDQHDSDPLQGLSTPIPRTRGSPSEDAEPPRHQYDALNDTQLFIFGVSQLIVWAINAANILETSFILPVIAQEFHVSPNDVQWVAASQMLTWGCFQLIAGRLCDIFGRKRGLIIGLSTSFLFQLLSMFMPNLVSLNIFRALAGISSAIILPASSGIIGSLYRPGKKRTVAYAAVSCGGCAGASAGMLLAAVFVRYTRWTWRPVYLSCAVMTLIPLVIGRWLVPPDPPIRSGWAVDWIGAIAIGVSTFLFLFSLTVSGTSSKGWKTPYVPALLVASALFLVFFIWRQRQLNRAPSGSKSPPPIVPRGLLTWKNRNLPVIYIASFLLWACIDGIIPFQSYLYFDVMHLDPFQAGLRMSTCFFGGTSAAIFVGLTVSKIPPRILISTMCLLSWASPLAFALRKIDTPFWKAELWSYLAQGLGTDAVVAAGQSLISHTASPEDQSVALALLQTSCRLGYPVGLAICTAIQTSFESRSLAQGRTVAEATFTGLRAAYWTLFIYIALATLTFVFGMKGWSRIHDNPDGGEIGESEHHGGQSGPDEGTVHGEPGAQRGHEKV